MDDGDMIFVYVQMYIHMIIQLNSLNNFSYIISLHQIGITQGMSDYQQNQEIDR